MIFTDIKYKVYIVKGSQKPLFDTISGISTMTDDGWESEKYHYSQCCVVICINGEEYFLPRVQMYRISGSQHDEPVYGESFYLEIYDGKVDKSINILDAPEVVFVDTPFWHEEKEVQRKERNGN